MYQCQRSEGKQTISNEELVAAIHSTQKSIWWRAAQDNNSHAWKQAVDQLYALSLLTCQFHNDDLRIEASWLWDAAWEMYKFRRDNNEVTEPCINEKSSNVI